MPKFDEQLIEVTRDYLGGIGQGPFCLYSIILTLTYKYTEHTYILRPHTFSAILYCEESLIDRYVDILSLWEIIQVVKNKNQGNKIDSYSITLVNPPKMTKKFFSQKLTDMAHRGFISVIEYEKILAAFEKFRTAKRKQIRQEAEKDVELWGALDFAKYIMKKYESLASNRKIGGPTIQSVGYLVGRISKDLIPHFASFGGSSSIKGYLDSIFIKASDTEDPNSVLFVEDIFKWSAQKKYLNSKVVTVQPTTRLLESKDWPVYLPRFKQWSKSEDFLMAYKNADKTIDEEKHWFSQIELEEKAIQCRSPHR